MLQAGRRGCEVRNDDQGRRVLGLDVLGEFVGDGGLRCLGVSDWKNMIYAGQYVSVTSGISAGE